MDAATGHFRDVPVELQISLGTGAIPLRTLISLAPGSVVRLEQAAGADLTVSANGLTLAVGEVVIIEDTVGIRVTHLVSPTGEIVN
ncbi:MAG TPA: FliM/FliN family flagellar motor switch protein [Vicinamibacterales bacterium]